LFKEKIQFVFAQKLPNKRTFLIEKYKYEVQHNRKNPNDLNMYLHFVVIPPD